MILHEFPDLTWLKSQIAHGFSNRLGWGNLQLNTEGFPSVVIHTKVRECFRPDIKGPFSFFLIYAEIVFAAWTVKLPASMKTVIL